MNKINKYDKRHGYLTWLMVMLLTAVLAGCGGGSDDENGGNAEMRDPILGNVVVAIPPTVTAVAPAVNATGVPINTKIITAAFSKPMESSTINSSSFTLTCPAGGTAFSGAVSYLAAGNVATLTLPALPNLPASTLCRATITILAHDTVGLSLASDYVWTFTTAATPDVTRPRVTLTEPVTTVPGPTLAVPTNSAITAIFTEDMAPASITATGTFTLTGPGTTPVTGAAVPVTYSVGSRTATFTPAAVLAASTTYTATITTAATDIALNALAGNQAPLPAASNYVWTFTTAAAPVPPGNISVSSTSALCPNSVSATFTVPSGFRMNDVSVAANFVVTDNALAVVNGTVALDIATGRVATFTPTVALAPGGAPYTGTISGGATGVKDNAIPTANTLDMSAFTFTFTPGPATGACTLPVPLLTASPFGAFGGTAGMTNDGNLTIVNGDIGSTTVANAAVDGFHDAADTFNEVCPGTPLLATGCGLVNGTIFTCAPSTTGPSSAGSSIAQCNIASQARLDAQAAFIALSPAAMPGGKNVASLADCPSCGGVGPGALQLGGRTIPPGVYTSATTYDIDLGGDLTLDGGGNPNAVWVFQMGSALNVGSPGVPLVASRSVILIGGAQAKNVFWQVGSTATINPAGGGTMEGNIIANSGVVVSTSGNITPVTVNGRLLSLIASVTLVNTIVNVPAP